MAMPGKFAVKKRKGGKVPDFNFWKIFGLLFAKGDQPISNVIGESEWTFWLCVGYFVFGIIFYVVHDDMAPGDAVYFLVTTMTTVGYGDVVPRDQESRAVSIFIVIYGVVVTMGGLTLLAAYIMDMRDALIAKTRAAVLKAATSDKSDDVADELDDALDRIQRRSATHLSFAEAMSEAEGKEKTALDHVKWLLSVPNLARKRWPIIDVVLYIGAYCVVWGLVFSSVEPEMTWIDAIYYCMVTGTTVGYGDVSPQTREGRWLAVGFLPFAVVFISTQMTAITDIVMGNATDGKLDGLLNLDLSLEALLAMDNDGDGEITEFEFLKFMLVAADMGDEAVLDALHARFTDMDEDGSGALTADDLPRVEPFGGAAMPVQAMGLEVVSALWRSEVDKLPPALASEAAAATRELIANPPKRRKSRKGGEAKRKTSFDTLPPPLNSAPLPIIIHEGTPRAKATPRSRVRSNEDMPLMSGGYNSSQTSDMLAAHHHPGTPKGSGTAPRGGDMSVDREPHRPHGGRQTAPRPKGSTPRVAPPPRPKPGAGTPKGTTPKGSRSRASRSPMVKRQSPPSTASGTSSMDNDHKRPSSKPGSRGKQCAKDSAEGFELV